jgi:hypothetical protein
VADSTQLYQIPFTDGILGLGWLRWFRNQHPKVSPYLSQGLDVGRAKGLYSLNVAIFCENLETMHAQGYEASHVRDCDEFGAQARKNGGGRVLAKIRVRSVHSIIPKEWEWFSILVCVNATRYHIPSFYIFHGKIFQRDYIKQYEDNTSIAMQSKAWMTGNLFKSWIGHLKKMLVIVAWEFHQLITICSFSMVTGPM